MRRPSFALAGLALLMLLVAVTGCKTLGAKAKTDPRASADTKTTAKVLSKEHVEAAGDQAERWNITFDIDGRSVNFDAQNLYGLYVVDQKVDMTYFTHQSGMTTITESRPHVSEPGPPMHSFTAVAVDESFVDDRYRWRELDNDTVRVRRVPGAARITAKGKDAKVRKSGMQLDFNSNFRVEMDVSLEGGSVEGDQRHFGLLWGMDEEGTCRGLFVSDFGKYIFGGFDKGRWTGPTRWWTFQGARQGGVNTLAVTRLDDQYILEVNGQRLSEMPVTNLPGKELGFYVDADATAVVTRISALADAPAVQASPAGAAAAPTDREAKAAQLKKLRDAGLITPEEYDVKMRELTPAAPAAPAAPADPKAALKAKMDDLERLHQAGLISDEEYEAKRAALIDQYLGQ